MPAPRQADARYNGSPMGRNKLVEDADVLAAARALFREVGHAASTRDVAEAAGISQGVLFQRFGTKDELFFRAMTSEAPDLDALFGPYPPRDGFESLVGIGERLAAYLRDFLPTLLKVLAHPGADVERLRAWHGELPFVPIVNALTERFRRMKTDGLMEGGDPHASAIAFISAIHSLVFFELMTTDHERKQKGVGVRAQVAVLWRGLEPREAAAPAKRRTKG